MKGMKRVFLRAFEEVGFLLRIAGYPVVSFEWYCFCRARGDGDAMKFAWSGVLGVVGALGMGAAWFTPPRWRGSVVFLAGILYYAGIKLVFRLALKKKRVAIGLAGRTNTVCSS